MLRIVGDVNFTDGFFDTGFGVGSQISKNGLNPFKFLKVDENDFWIGNLECVCSNITNKSGIEAKQFRIPLDKLNSIKHLGLYGVANNHVMQHGDEAFCEMISYLESKNIKYVGTNECKSVVFPHQNKLVGVVAFSLRPDNFTDKPLYWSSPEYIEIIKEIEKLNCDYKIVYVHWGNEFIDYPYIEQKKLAHYMIDMGADLIVGMHPHILQGYEIYKGKYIFYSIGNFVFDMAWKPANYSVVINVDFDNLNPNISYDYINIGKDFCPRYSKDIPLEYTFEHLNPKVSIHKENEIYYHNVFIKRNTYRKANRLNIFKNITRYNWVEFSAILVDFIKRRLNS